MSYFLHRIRLTVFTASSIRFFIPVLLITFLSGNQQSLAQSPVHLDVVTSAYPPFVFSDSTGISGFDIDLLTEICRINGWTFSPRTATFPDLILNVSLDSADVGAGAIYYTEERASTLFDFSAPYMETGLVLVTSNKNFPLTIKDITGYSIAVKQSATGERLASELNKKDLNLTINRFASTDSCFQSVVQGQSDGLINDYFNSVYLIARTYPGKLIIHNNLTGTQFLIHFPLAFPLGKTFSAVHGKAFNETLEKLKRNGFISDLQKKWMVESPETSFMRTWLPWLTYGFSLVFAAILFFVLFRKHRDAKQTDIVYFELEKSKDELKQTEDRYRSLLKQSSDGILVADCETFSIQESNTNLCLSLGYSESELSELSLSDLLYSEKEEKINIHALFNEPFSGEKQFRHKYGYAVSMDVRTSKVLLGNQNVWILTLRDISERKNYEEALRQSEESYRILFGQSPVGILTTDKAGIITRVNSKLSEILNLSDARVLVGQNIFSQIQIINSNIASTFEHALYQRESSETESVYKLADGRELFLKLHIVPLTSKGNEVIGSLTLIEDITDVHLALDQLKQSEERFRTLVESIPAPVIISSIEDGTILFVSQYAEQLLGGPVSDLVGLDTTAFYTNKNDRDEILKQITLKGRLSGYELKVRIPKGDILNLLASVSTIAYNGKACLLGIFTDITTRKKSEQALRESEEKFRLLFENAPLGIFHFDSSGVITACNQYLSDITGVSSCDILGKNYREVAALQDFTPFLDQGLGDYSNSFEGAYTYNPLVPFVRGTFSPIVLDDGGLIGGVGIIEDISQRKASEQALKESEEKYRSIFENMAEGIYQVTEAGTFVSVNDALVKMLGYSSFSDFSGINYQTGFFYNMQDMAEVLRHSHHAQLTKYVEVTLRKKDGTPLIVNLNPRIVRDDSGKIKYYEVIVIDVSDLKQTESERKKLEQQLIQTQRLESLGTLAGGIAHDFNNVLSMILMAAESMKILSKDNDKLLRYSDMVSSSAERGAAIAKQLLLFARSENIDLQPVDLSHVITEVSDLLLHSFPKSIRIETKFVAEHVLVLGNSGQIQQVIMNLSINGRDAMVEKIGDSGDEGVLTLALQEVSGWDLTDEFPDARLEPYLLLTISDTGTGIEDATLQRIFEPFFTTKERGKGTGLGLSIVHGIIRGHQGFITVKSEPGKGTTFYVYLPTIQASGLFGESGEAGMDSHGKGTILVVDDEELIRETLTEILKNAGYQILTGENGVEGLEVYKKYSDKIDLIISDMGMPHMNGMEFFKNLKILDPEIRLIFSTGYLEHGSKSDLLQKGAKDVIFKPFRVQDLLNTITAAMPDGSV